ncbi:hypothetical protein EMIHUDRAFT_313852 [Emiliania huxleyi CCMP1516]|uniref:Methyltransferase FkbM domain-containing protein n=4 Tax=Emiliania huxleyi TaxID=2903 RepID=A0A0D3KEH3_EMIH1|nr:hypothetical protein EMIHUDRAFT_313852 [Emiliania huxleyi CCMP1516]EOD34158.1 hypothetical protein EMIHUDRAFT_313852 [Emiliania huxleyi CCMP1516]|eukprot:XP_005786587.1 hypothetical protein EMIHUDRAFT_313852 [Emiliania huxleyi CCMP1516]
MLRLFVGLAAFTSTIPARRFGGHDGATGLAIDKEAVKTAGGALVAAFESCLGADPSAIGVVLDVGANDGRWSAKLMTSMAASVRRRTRLLMFEPQPRFVNALAAITNRFEPSLAGGRVDAGGQPDVPFSENARRFGRSKAITIRSVDLARLMWDKLAGKSCALLKLDVEGAEYRLIPHLLVTGALCLPTHLLLEWHLNSVPERERLAALAQRLSLPAALDACATPPRALVNDDEAQNNLYTRVPGLDPPR